MKNTVLFDLGNTLVYYFERQEFLEILRQAITEVQNYLRQERLLHVSSDVMWSQVNAEDYESSDYRVRPLEERLTRIFQIDELDQSCDVIMHMCRCFMKPILARVYCYEDTLPTLEELRSKGYRMAIVSNTTWGSPASLWREHVENFGLNRYMDALVFCRDAGWRKPAKQIFEYTLEKLQVHPQDCIFVGDDPRWDLVGPSTVGIEPVTIDRKRTMKQVKEAWIISNLRELVEKLKLL